MQVGEITFRNYYTASVSVLLLKSNTLQGPPMGSRNWEVGIKNRTLMNQPHCENGAQDYFSLFSTEVRVKSTTESRHDNSNFFMDINIFIILYLISSHPCTHFISFHYIRYLSIRSFYLILKNFS